MIEAPRGLEALRAMRPSGPHGPEALGGPKTNFSVRDSNRYNVCFFGKITPPEGGGSPPLGDDLSKEASIGFITATSSAGWQFPIRRSASCIS